MTTAGAGVGRGHLSRALSVAEALVGRGSHVSLELAAGRLEGESAARAERIGLRRTSDCPSGAIVVVDLPELTGVGGRAEDGSLVVFDDRDAFDGDAALVIQPSMPTWNGSGRADRVLAGYSYAPIARRYVGLREARQVTRAATPHVIVCFGGSDPALVTGRLAIAIASGEGWRTTIVLGADYAGNVDDLPPDVVRDPADLPERLARADLAVIGGGTMKFEVACVGRPAILLAVADDQLAVGPPFASTGAAEFLGDGRTIDPELVLAAVRRLVANGDRRATMGRTAAFVVDGLGAERIATAIMSMGEPPSPHD